MPGAAILGAAMPGAAILGAAMPGAPAALADGRTAGPPSGRIGAIGTAPKPSGTSGTGAMLSAP